MKCGFVLGRPQSLRVYKQLVPGWVCPSPDLPENNRLCIKGNRRLKACQLLGLKFWAFDIGRVVIDFDLDLGAVIA